MDNPLEDQKIKQQELSHNSSTFWSNIRFDRRLWDNEKVIDNQNKYLSNDFKDFKDCLTNKWQSIEVSLKTVWNRKENVDRNGLESNPLVKSCSPDTKLKAMSSSTILSLRI